MDYQLPECRAIPVPASSVHILETPKKFYDFLIERSQSAKNRISLSTLYLGDGSLERALVDSIGANLKQNENVKVTVLLDYLRGTRGVADEKSSTTLLKAIADKATIYLYHTPKLTGFVKAMLPERTNEIVGLQHMKLYIFDDTILISGANLSDSYFTDRQDRYVVFENCKELADFFHDIIDAVGDCSFMLKGDGLIELNPTCTVHPFEGLFSPRCWRMGPGEIFVWEQARILIDFLCQKADLSDGGITVRFPGSFNEYRELLRSKISSVITALEEKKPTPPLSSSDTVLYPLVQMGLFGYNEEYDFLKDLFASKDNNTRITMASGYFNCIKEYEHLIFSEGKYTMDIVTAAPKANGFFGAAGLSGYVPSMYSWVSERILRLKEKYSRNEVNLFEYHREGWTFHAKGLWVEKPAQTATLVGSSNFGYRSVHRDLEAQVLIVTSNEQLRSQLMEERQRLFEFSSILDAAALRRADHHIPVLVRVVSRVVRNFF